MAYPGAKGRFHDEIGPFRFREITDACISINLPRHCDDPSARASACNEEEVLVVRMVLSHGGWDEVMYPKTPVEISKLIIFRWKKRNIKSHPTNQWGLSLGPKSHFRKTTFVQEEAGKQMVGAESRPWSIWWLAPTEGLQISRKPNVPLWGGISQRPLKLWEIQRYLRDGEFQLFSKIWSAFSWSIPWRSYWASTEEARSGGVYWKKHIILHTEKKYPPILLKLHKTMYLDPLQLWGKLQTLHFCRQNRLIIPRLLWNIWERNYISSKIIHY